MAKKATTRTAQSDGQTTDEKSEATTTEAAKTETTDSKPEAETKPDPVVKEDEPDKAPETEITVPEDGDDDVREDPRQDPEADSERGKRARYYSVCELATRIFIAKCSTMNAKAFAPNHHAQQSWNQAEAFLDFMESKGEE